jgi:hypothetical protein
MEDLDAFGYRDMQDAPQLAAQQPALAATAPAPQHQPPLQQHGVASQPAPPPHAAPMERIKLFGDDDEDDDMGLEVDGFGGAALLGAGMLGMGAAQLAALGAARLGARGGAAPNNVPGFGAADPGMFVGAAAAVLPGLGTTVGRPHALASLPLPPPPPEVELPRPQRQQRREPAIEAPAYAPSRLQPPPPPPPPAAASMVGTVLSGRAVQPTLLPDLESWLSRCGDLRKFSIMREPISYEGAPPEVGADYDVLS